MSCMFTSYNGTLRLRCLCPTNVWMLHRKYRVGSIRTRTVELSYTGMFITCISYIVVVRVSYIKKSWINISTIYGLPYTIQTSLVAKENILPEYNIRKDLGQYCKLHHDMVRSIMHFHPLSHENPNFGPKSKIPTRFTHSYFRKMNRSKVEATTGATSHNHRNLHPCGR